MGYYSKYLDPGKEDTATADQPYDINAEYERIISEQNKPTQQELNDVEASRKDAGIGSDIVKGGLSGLERGAKAVGETIQWFAPEGSTVEKAGKDFSGYMQGIRDDNPKWFTESTASQAAREGSAWNPRGWLYGASESLGMLAPSLAAGAVATAAAPAEGAIAAGAGLVGTATVATQFWGSTAQQAYDEASQNEQNGTGPVMTESQKVQYANLRGFWEGGLEAIQEAIPLKAGKILGRVTGLNKLTGIVSKLIPKSVEKNVILSAVGKSGNPLYNSAKEYLKVISEEVPMELLQEYTGDKTQFEYGQTKVDPRWNQIKGVIGPTIIMSSVLGSVGQMGEASEKRKLHNALTGDNVEHKNRIAAARAIYEKIKTEDPELAQMWKEQITPALEKNKPVALPLDEDVRNPKNLNDLQTKLQTEVTEQQATPATEQQAAPATEQQVAPTTEQQATSATEQQAALQEIDNRRVRLEKHLADMEAVNDVPRIENAKEKLRLLEEKRQALVDSANAEIDAKAAETHASPTNDLEATPAQILGNNAKLGHLDPSDTGLGMAVTVENDKGSIRSNKDPDAKPFSVEMKHHYGYLKGTTGLDKDHLDIFIGPEAATSDKVFIVDQINPETGKFDEHKSLYGFNTVEEAKQAYHDNYESGWQGFGGITEMSVPEFKEWSTSGGPQQGPLTKGIELPSVKESSVKEPIVGHEEFTRSPKDNGYHDILAPDGQVIGQVKTGSKKALQVEKRKIERYIAETGYKPSISDNKGFTRTEPNAKGYYNVVAPSGEIVGKGIKKGSKNEEKVVQAKIDRYNSKQKNVIPEEATVEIVPPFKPNAPVQKLNAKKTIDSINKLTGILDRVLDCVRS